MRFKSNAIGLLVTAGLSFVALAPVAHAATLEEIVVTAQKRSQNLQDVPIAVSAFTGETLENLGIGRTDALEELTPGLSIRSIGASTIPYIRGVGADAFALGNESPNALYIDGTYISHSMNSTQFEFFDVERVEVLKGPQGTLFGRNATGGAINVITRKPTAETTGRFELTSGNYGELQAKGYLSGAISKSAGLFGSLSVVHKENDGYWTNIASALNGFSDEEVGESETDAYRLKLLWEASENLSFTLAADSIDGQDRGALAWQALGDQPTLVEGLTALGAVPAAFAITAREPFDFSQDIQPFGTTETEGFSLTVEWSTDFADIKYIGSDREFFGRTSADGDVSPLPIASFFSNREVQTTTHEIQFSSNSDGPFSWIGGLYYIDDLAGNGTGDDHFGLPNAAAIINIGLPHRVTPAQLAATLAVDPTAAFIENDSTRIAESKAIFGEGTYNISDRTRLTLGLRYTDEELLFTDRLTNVILPDSFVNPSSFARLNIFTGGDITESYEETTGTVILDHNFTDDVLAYASFKTGFKSGIFDTGTPTSTSPSEPEDITAFELGLKSTLLDGTMRLNAAVFQYSYDNLQVNSLDPATNSVVTENAAEAEILGLDLNMDWVPTENFSMALNISLLDTEYTDFPNASVDIPTPFVGGFSQGSADLTGFSLTQAPEWSANISMGYNVPLNDAGSILFNANAYFSDSVIYNQITNFETGSYNQVSASATWSSANDRYYIRLWGRNITDEVVPACNAQIAFGNLCNYRPPATYGVTAGIRFGG